MEMRILLTQSLVHYDLLSDTIIVKKWFTY